jgi:1D-myo-inositol 3-kinase
VSLRRPQLLVLGHVTRDRFGTAQRVGGAAAFATQAAVLLGIDTALVTVAPRHAPELDALRELPGLQLAVADSERITTFGHEFVAERRQLSLLECARALTWEDVPPAWRAPELLYAGPVAGECGEALLERFPGAYAIGCIQGWLRDPVVGRLVRPRRLSDECRIPGALRAVSFSASDHPGAGVIAGKLAAGGVPVAVTRGRRGARVSWGQHQVHVAAAAANPVDPTGAGDVFALIFGLSLWAGSEPAEAARRAALAAARVVEGPGLGTLEQARADVWASGSTFAPPGSRGGPDSGAAAG